MPEGRGGRLDMPFTGIPSFLRSKICEDIGELDADIAIVGAPTDEGSPYMPGSRFGARAIREHSLRSMTDPPGCYDVGRICAQPRWAQGLETRAERRAATDGRDG